MTKSSDPHDLHGLNMSIRGLFGSAYRAGFDDGRAGKSFDSGQANMRASKTFDHVRAYLQPAEQLPADALEALRAVEIALELAWSPKTDDDGRSLTPAERIRIMGKEISELGSLIGDISESNAMTIEGLHSYIEGMEAGLYTPTKDES
jgi:hypothetical protein